MEQFDDEMTKLRRQLEARDREQREKEARMADPLQKAREQQLIAKIVDKFIEREVSFFDCFHQFYDPLNPKKNIISISQFKKSVRTLNLPLTV
jgi:hypothetical protein